MMIDRPIFHHGSQDINLKTAGWIIDIFHDEHVSVETLDVLMWHIGAGYEWTGSSTFVDAPPEVDKQLFVACKKVFVKRRMRISLPLPQRRTFSASLMLETRKNFAPSPSRKGTMFSSS